MSIAAPWTSAMPRVGLSRPVVVAALVDRAPVDRDVWRARRAARGAAPRTRRRAGVWSWFPAFDGREGDDVEGEHRHGHQRHRTQHRLVGDDGGRVLMQDAGLEVVKVEDRADVVPGALVGAVQRLGDGGAVAVGELEPVLLADL